jgi:hypothetical protein
MEWKLVGYDKDRNPIVEFHLTNASDIRSATTNPAKKDYPGSGSAGTGRSFRGERYQIQDLRWRETLLPPVPPVPDPYFGGPCCDVPVIW